jgi:UDP-N-acetylglucosamine:LPS N-acetylglucosamine transferase
MADAGAAVVVADSDLTPALMREAVDALLDDPRVAELYLGGAPAAAAPA